MNRRKELLMRVYLVFLGFLLFSGVIVYRVVKISVIDGEHWRSNAEKNLDWQTIEAQRGDVFAEDGNLLATDVTYFDVYMDLTMPSDKVFDSSVDSLSYLLAKYSGKQRSAKEWKRVLVKGRSDGKRGVGRGLKYFPIAKKLDFLSKKRFERFPIFREGRYGGGFIVDEKCSRSNPFGMMAYRLIGKNRKNAVNVGVEGSYDSYLKGEVRNVLMKRIAPKVWVPYEDPRDLNLKRGNDVMMTLDVDIQDVCHNALMDAMEFHKADGGTIVVMDVETGAIKAMSNFSMLEDSSYYELKNHAVLTETAPGSTVKAMSTLLMLDTEKLTVDSKVKMYGGRKKVYDQYLKDSHPHSVMEADLRYAFAESSNVGIGYAAHEFFNKTIEGRKQFVKAFKLYGAGSKTGVDLVGEHIGVIRDPVLNPKTFSGTTVPWMAHGYAMAMTPLQVLNFYNTIANDGKMMKPYLVRQVMEHSKVVKTFEPTVLRERIANVNAVNQLKELLLEVVHTGTAKSIRSKYYEIAGKTGTAKDYGRKLQDGKRVYNASFAGYFPAENPKYSMIVVVYNPRRNGYSGGVVAGPVFKKVADKIFALKPDLKAAFYEDKSGVAVRYQKPKLTIGSKHDLKTILKFAGVPVDVDTKNKWVVLNPYNDKIVLQKRSIKKKQVPDLLGMGLKDVLYIAENLGLDVEFSGVGKVSYQSVKPGTAITGQKILVKLS